MARILLLITMAENMLTPTPMASAMAKPRGAVFAAPRKLGGSQHGVQGAVHFGDGLVQALELERRIFGHELADAELRLVQDRDPGPQPAI